MTNADWMKQHLLSHGREWVMLNYKKFTEETGSTLGVEWYPREVRRYINEIDEKISGELKPRPEESFDVQTVSDSLDYHDVPEDKYGIKKVTVNTWGSPTNPNKQLKLELIPHVEQFSIDKWAEAFKKAIEGIDVPMHRPHNISGKLTYVISTPDIHYGKIVYGRSVSRPEDDYNIEVAKKIFNDSVMYLASAIDKNNTDTIIFPFGEDFFNVDTYFKTTTKGTPQNNSDVFEMIHTGISVVFGMIDYLAEIADIYIPVIAGNHDKLLSNALGIAIRERYRCDKRVTVNTEPSRIKAYGKGQFGLLFAHGNGIKPKDLAWEFPSKFPEIWSQSKYREIFSGHFHTNSVIDEKGVRLVFLPSLAPSGLWEDENGYQSIRECQMATFHEERGRIATSYYSPYWES